MFTSFCENNKVPSNIYILHSELTDEDVKMIRAALESYEVKIFPIDVSGEFASRRLPTTSDWSREIYYRLLLPTILPIEVDRIFYFDVDVIIHGNLEDLYLSDFNGADLMAAWDSNGSNKLSDYPTKVQEMLLPICGENYKYFNSGVMLLNIAQMRDRYSLDVYLEAMKEWNYEMAAPDQDILNYVHHDKVKYFDWQEYDLFSRMAYLDGWNCEDVEKKNKILHFAGVKPWSFDSIRYEIEEFWWKYAKLTPCKMKLMELFLNNAMTNNYMERQAIRMNNESNELAQAIKKANAIIESLKIKG
jgi:lipopolysaccharide biosynthesis glycosyltransferase